MLKFTNRKGQSTVEWVLLAGIVVGLIVLLYSKIKDPAKKQIDIIATGISNTGDGHP